MENGRADDATERPARLTRRALLGTGGAAVVALSLGTAGTAAAAASTSSGSSRGEAPFGPVTVTDPGSGASYARAVRLSDRGTGGSQTFLATFQQFDFSKPGGFEVFRSDDGGRTWLRDYWTMKTTRIAR